MDNVPLKIETQKLREWLFEHVPTGTYFDSTLLRIKYYAVERRMLSQKTDPFTYNLLNKNKDIKKIKMPELADKLEAKKYAASMGCPTIETTLVLGDDVAGFIEAFEAIRKNSEINYILKGSSSSADNLFIEKHISAEHIKKYVDKFSRSNYYKRSREIVYKHLVNRLFIEPCLEPMSRVRDLKIHVFHGVPQILQIDNTRFTEHTQSYWNFGDGLRRYNLSVGYEEDISTQHPPVTDAVANDLVKFIKKLNIQDDYIRVDFLNIGGFLYLGEFTFFPWGLARCIKPASVNSKLADRMLFKDILG